MMDWLYYEFIFEIRHIFCVLISIVKMAHFNQTDWAMIDYWCLIRTIFMNYQIILVEKYFWLRKCWKIYFSWKIDVLHGLLRLFQRISRKFPPEFFRLPVGKNATCPWPNKFFTKFLNKLWPGNLKSNI